MTNELTEAIPFQVHRKTDYPPMADQLKAVFNQVLELRRNRKQQVRKPIRVRRHLDAVILDCWIAANHSDNPWRTVSRNKTDYRKETRYRRIYLKYDLLMGILDDLVELGYIDQKIGFHDRVSGIGRQTRIKATNRLLEILNHFDIKQIVRDPEAPLDETIIKKDADGKLIDYVDDRFITADRAFLFECNNKFMGVPINTDNIDIRCKHDPTSITLKRIFKGEGGGRFYGGFWQTLPKPERQKLLLDNGPVVELDYSAYHPTIAYAFKGITLTDDPYTIDGCERSDVKKAFLVLFNCRDRKHAINTIRSFGVKNVAHLVAAIEAKHEPIKGYFYDPGFGMTLQNTDSWICESIMKSLMADGIVCLPIHDSFIVAEEHAEVLRGVMLKVFFDRLGVIPKVY